MLENIYEFLQYSAREKISLCVIIVLMSFCLLSSFISFCFIQAGYVGHYKMTEEIDDAGNKSFNIRHHPSTAETILAVSDQMLLYFDLSLLVITVLNLLG